MGDLEEHEPSCESFSTISVDSTTCSQLLTNQAPAPDHHPTSSDQVVLKLKYVEEREGEIEHVLLQNNKLMRDMLSRARESKSKNSGTKQNSSELKKRISELETEVELKTNEIQSYSATDKSNNAQRLKIDQAAAAVKDLRDQLYEKDRRIDEMKIKVEHDYTAMVAEANLLRLKLKEAEGRVMEAEGRCDALTNSLEENQSLIDSLSEQLLEERKSSEDCKSQLAVLSCQENVNRHLIESNISAEFHTPSSYSRVLAAISALMHTSDGHFPTRPGLEGRGIEHNYGAALAASHGEQTAPPTPSTPYSDYSEFRHY